jgi:hypothetical protein
MRRGTAALAGESFRELGALLKTTPYRTHPIPDTTVRTVIVNTPSRAERAPVRYWFDRADGPTGQPGLPL